MASTRRPGSRAGRAAKKRHRIFDRISASGCARAIAEAIARFDHDRRWAVAENWAMDHRVSREREAGDLRRHLRGVSGVDDWWQRRGDYFQDELCRASLPASGDESSAYLRVPNSSNLLPRVAGFNRLVHVGSLNSMLGWLSHPSRLAGWRDVIIGLRRLSGFRWPNRPRGAAPDWFDRQVDHLARALQAQPESAVRQTAGLLANAFGSTEPPWWACFSHEISHVLSTGEAAALCAALGLGHRREGEWLLVWEYTVDDALPLYRPTVLEANNSPFHFPSPPEATFGITMPLHLDVRACREVLHPPLRGFLAADRCTGKLLHLGPFPVPGDNRALAEVRAGHVSRLRREFATSGLTPWLRRHPLRPPV